MAENVLEVKICSPDVGLWGVLCETDAGFEGVFSQGERRGGVSV